jgi:hypothetical protein
MTHCLPCTQVTTINTVENSPSKLSLSRILKLNAARGGALDKVELAVLKTTNTEWKRHRFLDMYLYNRYSMRVARMCKLGARLLVSRHTHSSQGVFIYFCGWSLLSNCTYSKFYS